jgi:tRNA (guanine10-N2)-dimethyltransferase
MYIALLGRQPSLGNAELERVFGGSNVTPLSPLASLIDTPLLNIERLGGSLKAGEVAIDLPKADWHSVSQKVVQHYSSAWSKSESKITLGVSAYGFPNGARDVQKLGIILKSKLKQSNVSLRLIPNTDPALSTATSHHNKLGLSPNKVELLIVKAKNGRVIVAESTGAQNITAYTRRDQARPKRDAFVGMLPPKLAQIMINLAHPSENARILDPFCGTGVILQEAALMGHPVYGTDLVDKMISHSRDNLNWLADSHHISFDWYVHLGDAMTTTWQAPVDAVVAETYLGQPFSAPPSPPKLAEVRKTCNHIITEFLKNLSHQIAPGTPMCIAVPAWKAIDGSFTHLPLIETIATLGFKPHEFHNVSQNNLLYYREDQVVARELLVLTRL